MLTVLFYRLRLLAGILLLAVGPAQATHLLGGEMTYRYLGATGSAATPLRYEITVTVYNNCSNQAIRGAATVSIYDQSSGSHMPLTASNTVSIDANGDMVIEQTSITGCEMPYVPPGCTVTGVSQPYQLQKFVGVVSLPDAPQGYYALWSDRARNTDITNLLAPGSQSMTLYTMLSPSSIPNSSPVFSDVAVAVICASDTTYLLNNAVDPDGDRLTYTFGQPYGIGTTRPTYFVPTPPLLAYKVGFGYSAATPLGTVSGSYAAINFSTGIAKYVGGTTGAKYAVAVDVNEYRTLGGQQVLIGTTRRDLQLVVATCPPTTPPVLPTTTTTSPPTPRYYTIEAGNTLNIPLASSQADGHPLVLTLNSVLLDGPGGYNATLNGDPGTTTPGNPSGTATIAGAAGTVAGTFVYAPGCNDARPTPYDVALLIKDNGCAGKLVADVLHITVTKPTGPTALRGDSVVCGLNTVHSYTASGGTAPVVRWRATGGTILGSNTANPIQINWPTAGSYRVVAVGVTQYGCLVDSVVKTVEVRPITTLTVAGSRTICRGSSTTLMVAGTGTYTVAGGAAPLTGRGPFVLSPATTTTYTITEVITGALCPPTARVTITVLPTPPLNVGAPSYDTCSGATITLGTPAVAGLGYSWNPATGLSSTSTANPTLTLTNFSNAPTTQTYTLTVTDPTTTCTSTGTVVVVVNPALVPNTIGAGQTVCAGSAPAPLTDANGPVGTFSTYVYQWEASPDNATWAALASATSPTYAPGPLTTSTYYRRHLSVSTCTATYSNVIYVRVQPLASVQLPTLPAQCAGTAFTFVPVPADAGPTPIYQWFVNGSAVATTLTYTSTTLADGDQVRVELTPSPGFCTGGQLTATALVSLVPVPPPTVAISLKTALPVCANDPVTFGLDQATNAGTSPQYQWQVDGVAVAGATGTTFTSTTLRTGQAVTLTLRTINPCGTAVAATSSAVRVVISLPADVEAGPDKIIMEGESVVLEGRLTGNYPVTWTPAQTLTFGGSNQLRPEAAPILTTTYTLAAGAGFCADQSQVTVTVTPRVRVPNAFTPNGDNNDDTWQIENISAYPNNRVQVFNRWGNKIFEASGYDRATEWKGTINGQPAPIGTYYYVITLGNHNNKSYTGPLTIVY
ncbi:MAG: T9SS type B sorting domain-containing protein [Hymenobacter sp.]|nr:MAG: T9SS type B sorting domain-containing protein [Hymenobacter sp.]